MRSFRRTSPRTRVDEGAGGSTHALHRTVGEGELGTLAAKSAVTGRPSLPAGTELQIVKLAPDGNEATRYPGRIIDIGAPSPWIAVRADWVLRQIELDRLQFVPGDTLHEFFSPDDWFNCFSVWSPEG